MSARVSRPELTMDDLTADVSAAVLEGAPAEQADAHDGQGASEVSDAEVQPREQDAVVADGSEHAKDDVSNEMNGGDTEEQDGPSDEDGALAAMDAALTDEKDNVSVSQSQIDVVVTKGNDGQPVLELDVVVMDGKDSSSVGEIDMVVAVADADAAKASEPEKDVKSVEDGEIPSATAVVPGQKRARSESISLDVVARQDKSPKRIRVDDKLQPHKHGRSPGAAAVRNGHQAKGVWGCYARGNLIYSFSSVCLGVRRASQSCEE